MTHSARENIDQLRHDLASARDREHLLTQIDNVIRVATVPKEITDRAAELLGRYLHVSRCIYAELKGNDDLVSVLGDYVNGLPTMVGDYRIRHFSDALYERLVSGQPFIIDDVETDPLCANGLQPFRDLGIRSMIGYPLMKEGRLTALLVVHAIEPRNWLTEEAMLVAAVAARCWESMERVRIVQALEADREELRRKSAESERRHAEIKTIYDTAPIGLAYFDLDGYHYLRLNERQAAFFGLTPAEVVGRTMSEMAPIPGLRELFDQVAHGKPVINYPIEGALATSPDNYRYWNVSYFPVYGPDGTIQGITAASQETTLQKKAEKVLLQTEKLAAVGRLAASIAHEINNPLESVTNLLYLAARSTNLEEVQELLKLADTELRRVSAITTQTLRFHRQATNPIEVDPSALVGEIMNVYQGRLKNSGAQLSTRLRTHSTVRCFDGEIRQVLANLIANSLDAMSATPGLLLLRTRESTNWKTGARGITLTVADSGSGIAKEATGHLFEPFFTTKGTTGTGLGLWVSLDIVTRHRGTLRVRSSRSKTHHGTVFTVFLPFDAAIR